MQRIQQRQPDAIKVGVDPGNNRLSCIDKIVASKDRQQQKFWRVEIETDRDIASVYFDYSFHSGNGETSHGR